MSANDFKKAHFLSLDNESPSKEMSLKNLNATYIFEGDIELENEDSMGYLNGSLSDVTAWKNRTWDYKNGPFTEIPYTLPNNDVLTENDTATIARAILEFRRRTCIRYDFAFIYQSSMVEYENTIFFYLQL